MGLAHWYLLSVSINGVDKIDCKYNPLTPSIYQLKQLELFI